MADVLLRSLLPLPHEVTISGYCDVAPADVRLLSCCRALAKEEEDMAIVELSAVFAGAHIVPTALAGRNSVERHTGLLIVVGLVDEAGQWRSSRTEEAEADHLMMELTPPPAAAARLFTLPNCGQAYGIEPGRWQDGDLLSCVALTEVGLGYAVQTLCQLFRSALLAKDNNDMDGGDDGTMARLPLPHVVDWPDVEERGIWGGLFSASRIDWMAALKLNYANQTTAPQFSRGVPVTTTMEPELMRYAAARGFRFIPEIVHLNFLDGQPRGYGLFREWPELRGRGDSALAGRYFAHGGERGGDQHRTVNANQPLLVEVLAQWMEDIARQCPAAAEQRITCWLSERPCADSAAETAAAGGQFVLEARAFVAAWRQAQRTYPHLRIRLFLSTTTPQSDDVILAEAPLDVGIVRCCILDTERERAEPRDRFRNRTLDNSPLDSAAVAVALALPLPSPSGARWLGTQDVPLTCNGRVETPLFMLPHSSAHRIHDFVGQMVSRGYSHLAGPMCWGYKAFAISSLNIAALAEWSWNCNSGRTAEEFILAYAQRQGLNIEQSHALVAWHDLLSEPQWDLFDSEFPTCWACPVYVDGPKPTAGLRTLITDPSRYPAELGFGPFRYFLNEYHLHLR